MTGILLFLGHSTQQQETQLKRMLIREATAHFTNIQTYRSWVAHYGGVFVRQTGDLTPNPYMQDNTAKTVDGQVLIKINPAWMTRQVSRLSGHKGHYLFHMTSLTPINPQNVADQFEEKALRAFQSDRTKTIHYEFGRTRFSFMGVLKVTRECMACHEKQGYKVGDIRGGIRVSIPCDSHRQEIKTIRKNRLILSAAFSGASMGILLLFYWFMGTIRRRQQRIEDLNSSLEEKVKQRTHEVEFLYEREKYLHDILRTVADVNEALVTSPSSDEMMKRSVERLAEHSDYHISWIALQRGDQLEMTHRSRVTINHLPRPSYSLSEASDLPLLHSTVRCLTEKGPVVHQFPCGGTAGTTSRHCISSLLRKGEFERVFGALTVCTSRETGFEDEEISMLTELASDIGFALHAAEQRRTLEEMKIDQISNYEETILAFVDMIEQRDRYTAGHSLRVAEYCIIIATELDHDDDTLNRIEKAAILHDIGKIATPDSVLLKPGKLTQLEFDLVKEHAVAGFRMLSKIPMYGDLAETVRHHHEKHDGSGYPDGLKGDQIPAMARVMIVADAFDAMTTARIYRPRRTTAEAVNELERCSGSQFHPDVVAAAVKTLREVAPPEDVAQLPRTKLEERRFAYFFNDRLTHAYNETYLQIVLNRNAGEYRFLNTINLQNFSRLNNAEGWSRGDEVLKQVAALLQENADGAPVFRVHGDDFVLLTVDPVGTGLIELLTRHCLEGTGVLVTNRSIDLLKDAELVDEVIG